jgi:hypothetical protein
MSYSVRYSSPLGTRFLKFLFESLCLHVMEAELCNENLMEGALGIK